MYVLAPGAMFTQHSIMLELFCINYLVDETVSYDRVVNTQHVQHSRVFLCLGSVPGYIIGLVLKVIFRKCVIKHGFQFEILGLLDSMAYKLMEVYFFKSPNCDKYLQREVNINT